MLTSDATLVSLFRSNAAPLPCPIKGPLEFTYSQGEGECNWPRSRAEACTQDSRLLLRYQACANVHSSESVGQYSPRVIITTLTCDKFILRTSQISAVVSVQIIWSSQKTLFWPSFLKIFKLMLKYISIYIIWILKKIYNWWQ